ncbi:MAG: 3-deoxy-D-manno-octulosonic acid transferase, partial [Candidatus Cloacimonadota bacterium]
MLIYNLLIIILFIALVPYLLFRLGKKEFLQRMGFIDLKFKSSVWIHAASVGEVNAVKPLVKRLLEEFPEKQFII